MSFKTAIYGKYFLLDRIATGGMAEVFKAKTFGVRGFERLLVIKRILPHLSRDEEFVEMFIDEAKISVELSHANICQVTDLGKISDNYFIAMEYIDGKDVRAILKKCHLQKTKLPIPAVLYITIEALKGLAYAHEKIDPFSGKALNIIHRDISPQNVMVSYEADVKIVDFGIAKTEAKLGRTQAGVLKGKFGYMSPEQAAGLELDARTDIFSVGIIMYEALTSRRLFLGENDFETLEKIKEANIPPIGKYNGDVSEELERIILKSLAKEKEDRFETALEMQTALSKLFYTTYADFSPRNLSEHLKELFAQEIQQEKESLQRAVDRLPKEEIEAAALAAEGSGPRSIASQQSSVSRRTGAGNASSPSKRVRPIGSSESQPYVSTSNWLRIGAPFFVLVATVLVTVIIGWRWLNPSTSEAVKAKPTKTEATPKEFSIQLTTEPAGADVLVNHQKIGQTPLAFQATNQETYLIEFAKKGYDTRRETIVADAQKPTFPVFTLKKIIPRKGVLHVESDPKGAKIFLNERDTGNLTPYSFDDVELEKAYQVRLELIGYETQSKEVTLQKSEDKIAFALKAQLVTLKIRVTPKNATVFLDGKERGQVIDNLTAGKRYELRIMAKGYQPITKNVTPMAPTTFEYVDLQKKAVIYGKININAIPWASIIVNDKEVGTTPLLDYRLPVGDYKIVFRNPFYEPVEKKIKIQKGQNPNLTVNFES